MLNHIAETRKTDSDGGAWLIAGLRKRKRRTGVDAATAALAAQSPAVNLLALALADGARSEEEHESDAYHNPAIE